MEIRQATICDLDMLCEAEAECFNPAERAERAGIEKRLKTFANHFLLLFERGRLAAYIDGAVTDGRDLADEMFENEKLHDEKGAWQMIFGRGVKENFRGRGYAAMLIKEFCAVAESEGRRGVVLTCKPHLVPFYSKFGFKDEGVCSSSHGGAVWHQMRMEF